MLARLTTRLGSFLAAFMLVAASSANAETINISSVTGQWLNVGGDSVYRLNGLGGDKISWGAPANKDNRQSSYEFKGASNLLVNDAAGETWFDIGTFTHTNQTLWAQSYLTDYKLDSIKTAQLRVGVTADFGSGVVRTLFSVFTFSHYETPNGAKVCANGAANHTGVNINGCADRVTLSKAEALSEKLVVGSKQYEFDIAGLIGDNPFWTKEQYTNEAIVQAKFLVTDVPPPSPVPLPAGGLLLLTGLGATVLLRHKRRA